ncbi:hypothetical protein N9N19_00385 [Porticoccaceae bacterium]|jgi:hypothetical protein|nr:hypothetical protein [Porticoccaceae bacterium]
MNYWFLITAAMISLVGMVVHGFIGGKIYMKNINDSAMEPLTKLLSLVSWHIFTIFLFISALTLGYTAYNPKVAIAVYPVIGVNLLGSSLFIFLGLVKDRILLKMPGAYLMGSTALLAWLGL